MYGRFGGLRFAKWLIYGAETRISRVRALRFRAPYSRYHDLGAIYKPLGIPQLPESATYKRVTHRKPIQDSPEHAPASRIRKNQAAPLQPPRRVCFHPQKQTKSAHFCLIPRKPAPNSRSPHPQKQTETAHFCLIPRKPSPNSRPPHPQNQTKSAHSCLILGRPHGFLRKPPHPQKQTKVAGPPNQRAGNRHR